MKKKVKQLPLSWNERPERCPDPTPANVDAWAGWSLIDDDLPSEVLQTVNAFVGAAWIASLVPDSFAYNLLIEDLNKTIKGWSGYANGKVAKMLQEVNHE